MIVFISAFFKRTQYLYTCKDSVNSVIHSAAGNSINM